ncbi:PIG-L family deacetylase [Streptomyces sp. SL13]|uniref:PIG-L family deacetylase n=1 Tax=Streptantibioticus silvisoli TaxID=2705255 RepID=A0AA90GVJ1_9ACTN|nr:PIG-L family deacetylase [Streptantibioticus silvisoli]MDI5968868.1 PIG-L family deacetylase [Streptantibioticus silvisoli]
MTRAPLDPVQAPGTPEQARPTPRRLPETVLPDTGRVAVVAAHPDDEALGPGGAPARPAAVGGAVDLVAVTGGEPSHPAGHPPAAEPAARRTRETARALHTLGTAAVTRLRLPDTGVAGHEDHFAGTLDPLAAGTALCAVSRTGDVPAGHEAAGRAAVTAARATGTPLALHPGWTWHRARPDDPRAPRYRARRVPLPPRARARERAATGCSASRTGPRGDRPGQDSVLPPAEPAHHPRPWEVVFR